MKNNHIPDIRFPGFTGVWEQRKLSDIKDVRDGTHDSPKYYNEGFPLVTSKNLRENGLDMTDVSLISEEDFQSINKRSKVDIGDIIFGMIGTIGNPVIVDREGFAIKNVALIKNGGDVTNAFLIQLLKSPIFGEYIRNENVGNTQKFLGLSKIRDYQFLSPSCQEQIKIGNFFKQLDQTINLHQQELSTLKQTKQGFLQKMFPKEGESVPEVRFPGFTRDWEQRKLGEISDVTKLAGFEFTKYVIYKDEGKIIALRGLNVKNNKLVLDDVKYIDQSDFSKLNRSKLFKDDILFTYVGTVGELAVVPENDKYYLAPNVARIRLNDNVNPQFVSQMMGNRMFYDKVIFPLIATSSQPALSMENVRKFVLKLPNIEEQIKIGNFFKQLDDTISLYQQELDALHETKKAFLQKMFV